MAIFSGVSPPVTCHVPRDPGLCDSVRTKLFMRNFRLETHSASPLPILHTELLVSAVSRPPPPPRSACWPQHKARPVLACLLTARLRLAQFCKLAKSLAKYPFCPRNSELCVLSRKYLHWLPSTSAKLSKTSVSQRSAQNIDCAENGKHI